jgi:hypothetical protein
LYQPTLTSQCTHLRAVLNYTRYNCPPGTHLLLSELLHVPILPLDRSRQHGGNLINDECPTGHKVPPAHDPEARPLHPLKQIMRIQNPLEEAILRDDVDLIHALLSIITYLSLARARIRFLRHLLLLAERSPPDLAQLIVVEEHQEEAGAPRHEAEFHARAVDVAGGVGDPVGARGGTVAAEPAGELRGVGGLEVDCEDPGEGVDGGN